MKAAFSITFKNDKTGRVETLVISAHTSAVDEGLFQVVPWLHVVLRRLTHLSSVTGVGTWINEHQALRVSDCPAGFFAKYQQPQQQSPEQQPQKGGEAHG